MCDEKPEGYRGEHELRRHQARAHGKIRKVWVCIEKTEGSDFLQGCDNCKKLKKYNAYYNAAAHLRRRHFNAKPKGEKSSRKLKPEEKRGGKGGGREPAMEELKKWMVEFEIDEEGTPLHDRDLIYISDDSKPGDLAESISPDDLQYLSDSELAGVDFSINLFIAPMAEPFSNELNFEEMMFQSPH